MATTTNYGWTTPNDTDLVKDGAAAIRTLGSSIDTTVFANASAGIPKTVVDAKGDLIAATAADTVGRLAVGANGSVLTADSATATGLKWAAAGASGKLLQIVSATTTTDVAISSTSATDTGITATITPTSATSRILVIISASINFQRTNTQAFSGGKLLRGATTISDYQTYALFGFSDGDNQSKEICSQISITRLDSPATTSATTYKFQSNAYQGGSVYFQNGSTPSTITLLEIGA